MAMWTIDKSRAKGFRVVGRGKSMSSVANNKSLAHALRTAETGIDGFSEIESQSSAALEFDTDLLSLKSREIDSGVKQRHRKITDSVI